MAVSDGFIEYVLDQLSSLENVKARKMFGGYGIYVDGIICAIAIEDILYIKTGEHNIKAFQDIGSQPFSYTNKNGKRVSMCYWETPINILEDSETLVAWIKNAICHSR